MKSFLKSSNHFPKQAPFYLLLLTSTLAVTVSIFSLYSGWTTIFQNLFYFPIILACGFYLLRGFYFSLLLIGSYLLMIMVFTQNPVVVMHALVRVVIFVFFAGVITYLSILRSQLIERLKMSEHNYHSLFDNAVLGFIKTTPTGSFLDMNAAYASLYGYDTPAEMKSDIFDIEHQLYVRPGDRQVLKEVIARSGEILNFETEHKHRSGSTIWVSINARAYRNDAGEVLWYEGMVEDITERKNAKEEIISKNLALQVAYEKIAGTEEELKQQLEEILSAQEDIEERERRYRKLFEANNAGIGLHEIICNDEGTPVDYRFIDVNPAFEELTGLNATDIIGKTVLEVLPGTEPFWIETYGLVAQTGKKVHFEHFSSVLGKYFEITAYSPESGMFVTLINDVSEVKLNHNRLQEMNSYLENLITYANVPIVVWDPDFRITRINHSFELLIGQSSTEIVGKSLEDLFVSDQADRTIRLIRTTLEGVRWETVEIPLLNKDGSVRIVLWNSATIYGPDGLTPVATIAQGRDVTGERILEKEKEASTLQIQENIAKLAILNDGIRNPLMIISVYADKAEDPALAKLIQDEIIRINEMVENLDKEWIQSDKILSFLRKYHNLKDSTKIRISDKEISDVTSLNLEKFRSESFTSPDGFLIEEIQAQLYTILDSIDAIIYVADMDTYDILYINNKGRSIFGDEKGRKCYQWFQNDNFPCSFCTNFILKEGNDTNGVYRWELNNPKDGRWYDCQDRIIRWTDGHLVRIEIAHDITDRKIAEVALRESEERYRILVDSMHETMSVIDRNGTFLYSNALAAYNLSGRDPSFVIGRNIREFVSIEKAEELIRNYQETIDTGVPFMGEVNMEMKGKSWHFLNRLIPIRYHPDPDIVILSLSLDITEQHMVRESLAQREDLCRRIVDTAKEGFWQVDKDLKTIYVNQCMAEMLGYTPDEMIGKDFSTFVTPEDLRDHISRITLRNDKEKDRYIRKFIRKNGEFCLMQVSATTLKDSEGIFYGSFALIWDITELKRAEDALKESAHKLRLLIGITRHDILNEICTIDLLFNLVKGAEDIDSRNRYINECQSGLLRIEEIIAFTRQYEDLVTVSWDWHPLRKIIESAMCEIAFGEVRLEIDIPVHLEVYADPLIRKVFSTLMDNAISHGRILTKISFYREEKDNCLIIVCEDDGCGIAVEEKEQVFSHGYGKKTGFGLSLSREILSITGLSIRECGVEGKGARFEILVPREKFRCVND